MKRRIFAAVGGAFGFYFILLSIAFFLMLANNGVAQITGDWWRASSMAFPAVGLILGALLAPRIPEKVWRSF